MENKWEYAGDASAFVISVLVYVREDVSLSKDIARRSATRTIARYPCLSEEIWEGSRRAG